MRFSNGRSALLVAVAGVALVLGCEDEGCDDLQPLEKDLEDVDKVYDGIQVEVSPDGFEFLELNFDVIVETIAEDGLAFDLDPEPGSCSTFSSDTKICNRNDPCPVTAELRNVFILREEPDTIRVMADLWAHSGTNASGPANDKIPICAGPVSADAEVHIMGKPVSARVRLGRDSVTHGLEIDLSDPPEIEITDADYTISGGLLAGAAELLFKGRITDMMNDMLEDELIDELDEMVDDATCMECDLFTLGCEGGLGVAGVHCDEDKGWCMRSGGCVRAPLGVVGRLDLGEMLDGMLPSTLLDLYIGAGQRENAYGDPFVPHDGGPVQVRVITGLAAESFSPCVPSPSTEPSTAPPPRIDFGNESEGLRYHIGIGISDRFLNKALYEVYRSGGLCIDIDSEVDDMISTGLFATFLPSLGVLTGGDNTPMIISLRPKELPEIHIGKGTYIEVGSKWVMEEPLINLYLNNVHLDFYGFFEERYYRLFTLDVDLYVPVGLEATVGGQLLPLLGDLDDMVTRIEVKNSGILAEDTSVLEDIVPTIIGLVEPMLDDLLDPIDLPELEGFELDIRKIEGIVPHGEPDRYEHIGIFARLGIASQ